MTHDKRLSFGNIHSLSLAATLSTVVLALFTVGSTAQTPTGNQVGTAQVGPASTTQQGGTTNSQGSGRRPLGQNLPSESLGADDLLEVMVSYCPELTRSFRVGSDGTLALPLLKEKLKVVGMTPIEVANELARALVSEHVLTDPTVNVSVLEYRSRPVSVVGAVNHPLTFQATGRTTLLDAVAQGGGLAPTAGGNIILTTHRGENGGSVQVISVHDLLAGKDGKLNVEMQGGEEVRVPEADKIFVAGNVKRPGMYTMQGDSETTVIKAIALSSGLDSYASHSAFIYRRNPTGGDRQELEIPLNKIISRKSPDVFLHPDDILFIPDSSGRRMTSRVLSQLAGFGAAAGTGMLIYK